MIRERRHRHAETLGAQAAAIGPLARVRSLGCNASGDAFDAALGDYDAAYSQAGAATAAEAQLDPAVLAVARSGADAAAALDAAAGRIAARRPLPDPGALCPGAGADGFTARTAIAPQTPSQPRYPMGPDGPMTPPDDANRPPTPVIPMPTPSHGCHPTMPPP